MNNDNVLEFKLPEDDQKFGHDMLTEVIRSGARQLLSLAVEAEVGSFIESHQQSLSDGRARLVRNGYLPEREVTTGIGPVTAKVPRVRDRDCSGEEKIKFESNIIPKYLRRSGDINELLPLLYLKGLSTGEFVEALVPMVGEEARNISPSVISRLKSEWGKDLESWRKQDLSKKRYVYWWADGIYLTARMEHEKQCILVIIAVTDRDEKELIAMEAGFRESKESWRTLLKGLKSQGLSVSAKLAVGDGALGFWGALNEEFPRARHQRCWFHKMGNVLNLLPKSLQPAAKAALQEIWMASTRKDALKAFNSFCGTYEAKYPRPSKTCSKTRRSFSPSMISQLSTGPHSGPQIQLSPPLQLCGIGLESPKGATATRRLR